MRFSIDYLNNIFEITGITVKALARKLKAPSEDIENWKKGISCPTEEQLEALNNFIKIADEPALEGPRIASINLDSRIINADCRNYLTEIPDNSIDMILSDIPYGIGLDDWDVLHDNKNSAYMGTSDAQKVAGKVFEKRRKPINGWSKADKNIPHEFYNWCRTWSSEWLRVLKPGGSAFVFSGRRYSHRCISALEDDGFNLRDILSWKREKATFKAQSISKVYQKRGCIAEAKKWEGWRVGNLQPIFEPIIWCFKPYSDTIAENMLDHNLGAINMQRLEEITGSKSNALQFDFEKGEKGHHEAQKPISLLKCLIEMCTVEGTIVLDPFAGSCSTAVAAIQTNRKYIAIEADKDIFDKAEKRLKELL